MRKRFFAALLAACMILSGCQLAKPDDNSGTASDQLVGVLITMEYLDLWDTEAFLTGHTDEILAGSTITGQSRQQGKLFARLVEEAAGGGNRSRYVFEGVDGIVLASYLIKPNDIQSNEYWSSEVTEGICDVFFGHHAKDSGCDTTLTGTIYLEEGAAERVFYFNPIYQTSDGQVYLVPGDGMSFGGGLAGSAAHRINAEHTQTENGNGMSYSCEIAVTMETAAPAREVRIYHMRSDHQILRCDVYSADQIPAEISPARDSAYLIVEEHTADGSIRRALYQSSDSSIPYFISWKNGICIQKPIIIQWA